MCILPYNSKLLTCFTFCPSRDSADRISLDQGKYEEVIVCSHEIAASTAQLVASSKVGDPTDPSHDFDI